MKVNNIFSRLLDPKDDEDLLFHYTKTEILIKYILCNKELKFSRFYSASDPLEFFDYTHTSIGPVNKNLANNLESEINSIIKDGFRVASFSKDTAFNSNQNSIMYFHKGYARSRMWSQYADKHTGICVIFSKKILLEAIKRHCETLYKKNYDLFYDSTIYDNELRELNSALTINLDEQQLNSFKRIKKYQKGYLFSKLEDYRDEQEYRIAVYNESFIEERSDFVLFPIGDSIQAIILGCNFLEVFKININDFSKKHHFDVFQIDWYKDNINLTRL